MGRAYMGSVCPERRSRPIYPESTTRGNEPNLSLLRLQASIICELADVPIGIYYPSCDSTVHLSSTNN
eukprot:scaffold28368_cov172-Skeletonema_dohrnii-CCMP3373.AAC.1